MNTCITIKLAMYKFYLNHTTKNRYRTEMLYFTNVESSLFKQD